MAKTGFRGPSPEVGKATQFKPGEVHNPHGRPKKRPVLEEIERQLAADPSIMQEAVKNWLQRFRKGDPKFATETRDMLDGKPVQAIAGPEGGSIPVSVQGIDEALRAVLDEIRAGQEHDST